VYKGGVIRAQKAFNIDFSPAASMQPDDLKTRAYDSITRVFSTILEDSDVRRAFFGSTAGS
jgi:hypothetical protein